MMNPRITDPGQIIRPAQTTDLGAVAALLGEHGLPDDDMSDRIDEGFCVADLDGQLIGMAGVEMHAPDGLLRSIAVSSDWQGKSLGKALVENRLAWARDNGVRQLYLLTTDAAHFFEKFGFAEIDRDAAPPSIKATTEFSSLCPGSATVMSMTLI